MKPHIQSVYRNKVSKFPDFFSFSPTSLVKISRPAHNGTQRHSVRWKSSSYALTPIYVTAVGSMAQYLVYHGNIYTLHESMCRLHADGNLFGFSYRHSHNQWQAIHCHKLKANNQISTILNVHLEAEFWPHKALKSQKLMTNTSIVLK